MYFRLLHDDARAASSYLLADQEGGEAVLVDPWGDDLPVLAAMLAEQRMRLRWVLLTHEHEPEAGRNRHALGQLGAPILRRRARAAAGEVLAFGHEHLRVLPTPGHTADCLSFLWRDRLFCGDLLATDACPCQPRPAVPEALWDSVTRVVFAMPAETLVFGNHSRRPGAVSSVLEQRRCHPWFGSASRDDFLARVRALPPSAHGPAPDLPGHRPLVARPS